MASPVISTKRRKCNWINSDSEPDTTRAPSPKDPPPSSTISYGVILDPPQQGNGTRSGQPSVNSSEKRSKQCAGSPVQPGPSFLHTRDEILNPPYRNCNTHCAPSNRDGCSISSWIQVSDEETHDHVIILDHPGSTDDVWDTSSDGSEDILNTSTPGFKRGRHDNDAQLRELIKTQGIHYPLPKWMKKRWGASLHILADNHLGEWPFGDSQCRITYMQHQPLISWVTKLQQCSLLIRTHIVVLYLQKLRNMAHTAATLKNRLAQVCRSVRSASLDCRIYVCNTLPSGTNSLMENQQITLYNKSLFEATLHVNRKLEKVYYVSMNVHFMDEGGHTITPLHKYFCESNDLTRLGCLIFWGCLVREVGITSYSLSGE